MATFAPTSSGPLLGVHFFDLHRAVPGGGGKRGVPNWIECLPAGLVTGEDGRQVDNRTPEATVAAFRRLGRSIPIDYDHGTSSLIPQGRKDAAGWIDALEIRNGAIWGRVEHWTDEARSGIETGAHRYLSPELEKTKDGLAIVAMSLTTRPNLPITALHNQQGSTMTMDLSAVYRALDLTDGASVDQLVGAITKLKGERDTALHRAEDRTQFVPVTDLHAVQQKVTKLEAQIEAERLAGQDREIDAAIDGALSAGKIAPASVEYHRAACKAEGGLDAFKKMVGAADPHPATQPAQLHRRQPGAGAQGLTGAEIGARAAEVISQAAERGKRLSASQAVEHVMAGGA